MTEQLDGVDFALAAYREDGVWTGCVVVDEETPEGAVAFYTAVSLPDADLHLLNAGDLTFAAVRPDAPSVELLLTRAGDLPDAHLSPRPLDPHLPLTSA